MYETILRFDSSGLDGIKREAVRTAFSEADGRLDAGELDETVRAGREHLSTSSGLHNRPKFRLRSATAMDGEVRLALGPTNYFDYLATNHDGPLNRALVAKGREDHGDPDVYLSNAIGNVAVVTTTDGKVVMLRRSNSVPTFAGYLDLPGGHPEPENVNQRLDEGVALNAELYGSILDEIDEEIGIRRCEVLGLDLIGIVRSFGDGRKPEMLFHVSTGLDSAALEARYNSETERPESVNLMIGSPEHFLFDDIELTVPARAALELSMAMQADIRPTASRLGPFTAVILDLDSFVPLAALDETAIRESEKIARLIARTGDAREIILSTAQDAGAAEDLLSKLDAPKIPMIISVPDDGSRKVRCDTVLREAGLVGPECLAVEKTLQGLDAAFRAGCATVAVGFSSDVPQPQSKWSIESIDELE